MTTTTRRLGAAALGLALSTAALTGVALQSAEAHNSGIHDNCTNLNKMYPHGVGTRHARDKTTGTRVTSFRRSNVLYWRPRTTTGTSTGTTTASLVRRRRSPACFGTAERAAQGCPLSGDERG